MTTTIRIPRRGAAAIALAAWCALLICWAQPAAGAAKDSEPAGPTPECESRVDDAWEVTRPRLAAQERAYHFRAQLELRSEIESFQTHRADRARADAKRRLQRMQIADLVPAHYQDLVIDTAGRWGVDVRMVAAVGAVESQWRAWAAGTQGDSGLMQIIPETARWIAGRMGLTSYDVWNPATNLNMGTWYLHTLYREYGNWGQALAHYNGGPRGAQLGWNHPYARLVLGTYYRQVR